MTEIKVEEFENLFLSKYIRNEEFRQKCLDKTDVSIFRDFDNKTIVKEFFSFYNKQNRFPTIRELVQENNSIVEKVKELVKIDIEQYKDDYFIDQTEKWLKQQYIWHDIEGFVSDIKEAEENGKFGIDKNQDFHVKIQEHMNISLNNDIGLEVFGNEEKIYDSLHSDYTYTTFGIEEVDQALGGGVTNGTLSIVLGGVNVGKSLTLCSWASHCIQQNKKVLYVTLEMSEFKTAYRIIANTLDLSIKGMKTLSKEDFINTFKRSKEKLKDKMFIKQYPTKNGSVAQVRNIVKEFKEKKNIEFDVIFVDYLELMKMSYKSNDSKHEQEQIKSEELRGLAGELDIPIITVAQVNRAALTKTDLDMSDMGSSIGPVKTCDYLLALTQDEDMKEGNEYQIRVLKNRDDERPNSNIMINVNYDRMRLFKLSKEEQSALEREIVAKAIIKNDKRNQKQNKDDFSKGNFDDGSITL